MITEDYVSYEIAKLLKKKGFDEATIGYYNTISEIPEKIKFFDSPISIYDSDGLIGCIQAPTLQMAMKWLREVHKIDITVDPHEVGLNWIYQFHICQNKDYLFSRDIDTSYENCAEAAIKYCLKNLI